MFKRLMKGYELT